MLSDSRIAFIGSGAMGEAIIKGLIAKKVVSALNIIASDPVSQRRIQMESAYGVKTTDDNVEAVDGADIVILCVKPQVAGAVMTDLQGNIASDSLVLSIMAGVPIATLQRALAHRVHRPINAQHASTDR